MTPMSEVADGAEVTAVAAGDESAFGVLMRGAEEFLRYATGPGMVLLRVRPAHVVAQARIAG